MTEWPELTRHELLELAPEAREPRILGYIQAVVLALREGEGKAPQPTDRLTELGLDSLQFVELKFALDTLAGDELDIELFVADPPLSEVVTLVTAAVQAGRRLPGD